MASTKSRNNISHDLKLEIIRQIEERGRLIADVAADFGVPNSRIYRWLKQKEKLDADETTRHRLCSEIADLRRQIFEKAIQIETLKKRLSVKLDEEDLFAVSNNAKRKVA